MKKGIPAKNRQLEWKEMEGEALVFNPKNNSFYKLNKTSCFIWKNINGRNSLNEINGKLLEKFDAKKSKSERDLKEFVSSLEKAQLIHFR